VSEHSLTGHGKRAQRTAKTARFRASDLGYSEHGNLRHLTGSNIAEHTCLCHGRHRTYGLDASESVIE